MSESSFSQLQRMAACFILVALHACGSSQPPASNDPVLTQPNPPAGAGREGEQASGAAAEPARAGEHAADPPARADAGPAAPDIPQPADAGKAEPNTAPVKPSPTPDTDAGVTPDERDTRWDEPYTGKYTDDSKWLCRPGLPNNPCDAPQSITEFHPDGSKTVSELPPTPADAGVDCFYTYPTVDTGLLAAPRNLDFPQIDLATVLDVMSSQALPFRPLCRIHAPVYRQASLVSFTTGAESREAGLEYGYADVADAFDYFLRNSDSRRPLVLLAHSQGAMVMLRLVQRKIENDPKLRKRLVVVVLAGPLGGFHVPRGQLHGGTFKELPLCSSQRQAGCVLTHNTFLDTNPPNANYATIGGEIPSGHDPGCTIPPSYSSELTRSAGALFLTRFRQAALSVQLNVKVDTNYARFGNFYSAQCKSSKQDLSYFAIGVAPLAGDKRENAVPFDSLALADASIGLHALDYSFNAAELFEAVKAKIEAHAHETP